MATVLRYCDALEMNLCVSINRWGRNARIRRLFVTVSRLGDGSFWFAAAGVCALLQGHQSLPLLARGVAAAILGVVVYKVMKHRFTRERPYITNGRILCGTPPLDRYSFPSGHTLHAVSLTILIGEFQPLMLAVAAPFALLVAISRVVLGLHYPSDVLVGAAVGTVLAALVLSV